MNRVSKIAFLLFLGSMFLVRAQSPAFEVSVVGEGSPVLLFPGFTCTGAVWDDTVSELSKEYECHVFTFAGFGEVPPIQKPWLPKIKEEIEAYVAFRELQNPIIIGHSLGGTLALWLASEENHPFSKLILVDALAATGALMIPNYNSDQIAYDTPYNKQQLEMSKEDFGKMADQMATGMTLNKEKQGQIKEWMLQADRETFVYGFTDLLKLDLRESIANISIPVTILAASHQYGETMARKTFSEQFKNLKDYKIEFAADAAHFVMYDQPIWFLEKVKKSLSL